MRELVSAILESAEGKLILQHRDNKPDILSPGKIALFGGHKEPGEDPVLTIKRELGEELELKVDVTELIPFSVIENKLDNQITTTFIVKGVDRKKLVLHEGQAIVEVSKSDNLTAIDLSPSTLAILSLYWQDVRF